MKYKPILGVGSFWQLNYQISEKLKLAHNNLRQKGQHNHQPIVSLSVSVESLLCEAPTGQVPKKPNLELYPTCDTLFLENFYWSA